jgi:long-chain acyl-CoA synthetase
LARLLAKHVEDHGEAPALIDELGETSWRQLDEKVNRLANALRAAGLESGDSLSIFSENRREYFELMAAATHCGLRYVPVNWHWVAEELAYVLADSGSRALVAGARFTALAHETLARDDCPDLALALVVGGEAGGSLESYEDFIAGAPSTEPEDQGLGGPMFYTSGTTGRPKGVVSSLFSGDRPLELMTLVGKGIAGALGLPEGGRTLLAGPIYHSAQWAFSYLPMLAGSSVVMRHHFDAAETLRLIDEYGVTNVHLVPTQFVRFLRLDEKEKASFDGSSLTVVWHGAARCPHDVKRAMIEWWGPRISEYYGSTEGAVITAISSEEWLARPGSVGRPLANVEIQVIREDGSVAGPGEEGQLYFRNSMGTDFEYHKDPEKTRNAHLEPGVFTVGDVGYLDSDGFLFMSDRKIDMIISGGVNIYPAEIEGVLLGHAAVVDAAVFGIPNEEYGEEVKAVVELGPGRAPSADLAAELMEHCRRHLAGYKVPRSIDFEEKLPRHETGKLFKRLLREPYWEGRDRRI